MSSSPLSLSPSSSSPSPSTLTSSTSLLSVPSPTSTSSTPSSSRRKLSPPSPLSFVPTPTSTPPPYCSSPPLISLSSPTIPSSPTKSELSSKEADEEEEEYPHVLATPTQQSYFVQLSGLFESEFSSARVGGEIRGKEKEEKRSESRERKVIFQEPTKEEKAELRDKFRCCIIA